MYTIRRLTAEELPASAESLSGLLMDAVDGGSSLGFLASLDLPAATAWWQALAPEVAAGRLALWVALDADGRVAGTVRLRPAPVRGGGLARAGRIPDYATDPAGALHPTTLFFKRVGLLGRAEPRPLPDGPASVG